MEENKALAELSCNNYETKQPFENQSSPHPDM